MATRRIIPDDDFGKIVIGTRINARNISMRTKKDGLYVIVPPFTKTERILRVIDDYRQRLLVSFVKATPKIISDGFSIDAPCFKLSVSVGGMSCFSVRREEEGVMRILCPRDVDFTMPQTQKLLEAAIVRAMKRSAEEFLPPLLRFWAEKYGMSYKKVRITGAKSRWGSCTSRGVISLSCYLMLLPVHLMDYVMLHELAHTKEMNHGPEFWKLLDSMTEGNSHQLRTQLRKFKTDFM